MAMVPFSITPKEADEDPNEQQAEQNYNGLDPDTPEKQAADEAVAQAAADQRVQQEADDARAKAAEAVKLPDSQGSEGDNALPKTAKSPKSASPSCPRTFQTYTKYNPNTDQTYSGRTSGSETPEENVARRDANHRQKNDEGYGPAALDQTSSNPDAIRGREQQLIEANGGAQSSGGTSGNAINGVSPNNPNGQNYFNAANGEFGNK